MFITSYSSVARVHSIALVLAQTSYGVAGRLAPTTADMVSKQSPGNQNRTPDQQHREADVSTDISLIPEWIAPLSTLTTYNDFPLPLELTFDLGSNGYTTIGNPSEKT